jgi:hypothetical protein
MKNHKWIKNPWTLMAMSLGSWLAAQTCPAACLDKTKNVDGLGAVHTFMIAPESEVADYASLGFTRIACPSDLSTVRAYVDRICSGAPTGPAPPINTDALFGRPRERACASAKAGLTEAGG